MEELEGVSLNLRVPCLWTIPKKCTNSGEWLVRHTCPVCDPAGIIDTICDIHYQFMAKSNIIFFCEDCGFAGPSGEFMQLIRAI